MLADLIEIARFDRAFIRASYPDIFIYGDNMVRLGYGGQAKEARNEPNCVGIPTKWRPSYDSQAYFNDGDLPFVGPVIKGEFKKLIEYRKSGYNIFIPKDGIGTGRADLVRRAPLIHILICQQLNELKSVFNEAN